jgi:predicted nucleic acid-binding Zn ribbon protein
MKSTYKGYNLIILKKFKHTCIRCKKKIDGLACRKKGIVCIDCVSSSAVKFINKKKKKYGKTCVVCKKHFLNIQKNKCYGCRNIKYCVTCKSPIKGKRWKYCDDMCTPLFSKYKHCLACSAPITKERRGSKYCSTECARPTKKEVYKITRREHDLAGEMRCHKCDKELKVMDQYCPVSRGVDICVDCVIKM